MDAGLLMKYDAKTNVTPLESISAIQRSSRSHGCSRSRLASNDKRDFSHLYRAGKLH
jgi:hypothetical protein